ncbi:MAG: cytochrome c maturation protein CcmE [Microthrixaceae bacterium]
MNPRSPLGGGADDEESQDATSGGLDVTPRPASKPRGGSVSSGRKLIAIGGIAILIAVLGGIIFKGLSDASMFYYNVDEAVVKKAEIDGKRFRMQGNVIEGSIKQSADGVDFTVAYGDAQVHVTHKGAPPELFSSEIPVVLEGEFVGDDFHSDEIIIRHDNNYDEKHSDRLKDAETDVKNRNGSAG